MIKLFDWIVLIFFAVCITLHQYEILNSTLLILILFEIKVLIQREPILNVYFENKEEDE